MTLKVKDIMVTEVVTIDTNATRRKAVKFMNKREVGCLVVVQNGKPTESSPKETCLNEFWSQLEIREQ